ncbi:hypothetical protein [Gimesia algae]|uniref:Glycosyltransferase RgtA/B/C/D-like domain-containing protein n=1 Tax=Gimesia algae TaxID=2527971 RepID=A0A517VCG7_9PLAN|nr:hypothetical protein [Gimesia algae]QDT90692.1 hypothetical protein Pan161_23450 [Gimesia algae]
MRFRTLLPFLLTSLITIALLWMTQIPLGVDGEWNWDRIPFSAVEMIPGWIVSGIAFAVYLLLTLLALSRMPYSRWYELAVWLTGLTAAGCLWSLLLQDSPPGEYRLSKAAFVLYYKGSSGYFTQAQTEISDASKFLSDYEAKMEQGDVLHEGTHPPGLPLFYHTLIRLSENYPGLQSFLLDTQPASFEEAADVIASMTSNSEHPLTPRDRAVLWLATLITLTMSSLTIVPLFLLAQEFTSRTVSWQVAAFWPLIPATLIFQPKSDALYPVIAMLFLYLWVTACRRNNLIPAFLAGLLIWGGLFLTLAFLPVGACAVCFSMLQLWPRLTGAREAHTSGKAFLLTASSGLAGFCLPILTLAVVFDLNLLRVWFLNFQNHAGFYSEYTRTYWKWLLLNPLEISLALGLPVSWMILRSLCNRRRVASDREALPAHFRLTAFLLSCGIVLILLWLSGKNMGEAARLWLIFLPWLLMMTIPYWQVIHHHHQALEKVPPGSFLKMQTVWIVALTAQAVVCVATVNRITGFHFPPG